VDRDDQLPAELEKALVALSEGRPLEALERLEEVDPALGERWTAAAQAELELGELHRAEQSLARARELLGADSEDLLWTEGRLRLHQWRVDEARSAFGRLDPEREGAPLLENLALLADLAGDFRRADELFQRAARLDSEGSPLPPRLSPERFEQLVAAAARDLPPEFRRALEEIAVVIDPMPTAEIVGAPGSGHPPDILGLFAGPPLGERGVRDLPELPPTIFLFQRNLERASRDAGELREEIRTTLYHELGHALGFDEDGVEELGLG
jgi:predicted Zn-dependent protease with MMP-like domain